MIKFFRKRRQTMIRENMFSKYLLYAIGEIVLVVIGILIALQINNRNELNKLEDKKQTYYNQLLVDIAKDTVNVHQTIEFLKNSIASYNEYIASYKNANMDVKTVLGYLYNIEYISPNINFYNNTITTLTETGELAFMPLQIRNNILEIRRIQNALENQRDQIDPAYIKLLTDGIQLGYGDIGDRLKNQKNLSQLFNLDDNIDEMILTMEAAYGLKNFIEINRLQTFEALLLEYRTLKSYLLVEKS